MIMLFFDNFIFLMGYCVGSRTKLIYFYVDISLKSALKMSTLCYMGSLSKKAYQTLGPWMLVIEQIVFRRCVKYVNVVTWNLAFYSLSKNVD